MVRPGAPPARRPLLLVALVPGSLQRRADGHLHRRDARGRPLHRCQHGGPETVRPAGLPRSSRCRLAGLCLRHRSQRRVHHGPADAAHTDAGRRARHAQGHRVRNRRLRIASSGFRGAGPVPGSADRPSRRSASGRDRTPDRPGHQQHRSSRGPTHRRAVAGRRHPGRRRAANHPAARPLPQGGQPGHRPTPARHALATGAGAARAAGARSRDVDHDAGGLGPGLGRGRGRAARRLAAAPHPGRADPSHHRAAGGHRTFDRARAHRRPRSRRTRAIGPHVQPLRRADRREPRRPARVGGAVPCGHRTGTRCADPDR